MRISDWSADVCSSDLQAMVEGRRRCVIAPPSALRAATSRSLRGTEDQVGNLPPAGRARARCADGADIAEDILEEAAFAAERRWLCAFGAEEGRTSCREEGLQYVEIPGVGGP